jgi:L-2-hydroxyglutarate oxidase LhgO
MDEIDCVVIGAGVIGLAVARALAQAGRETLILERESLFGAGTSSRNSEVIHAGIYYPHNSLKARFCVAGRASLYDYCAVHHIDHRRCGKLIVASSSRQMSQMESIYGAARGNGVNDLIWLDARQIQQLEPELSTAGGLYSPSTGIFDSHAYMLSLLGDAETSGAIIAYKQAVTRLALEDRGVSLWMNEEIEPSLRARLVINAAGLGALDVARKIEGFPPTHIPRMWWAKGSYFTLIRRSPFDRLIYPVPEPGGLGVHLTIDLGGQARFGPDVQWIDQFDYNVDPLRSTDFYRAIRSYWPGLRNGDLAPGYAGIRPKLSGAGEPAADFHIGGFATHGIPSIINLFGIESPGLTASLAIGDEVLRLAEESHEI